MREGGRGGGGGGGGGVSGFWFFRRTLGLIYGFTQRDPSPPPQDGNFEGWGSAGRGLRGGESNGNL